MRNGPRSADEIPLSWGGYPVYERHWQMEFYRAATSLLSSEHTISPDVGAVFGLA